MGRLVEVLAVEAEEIGEEGPLLGGSVDTPTTERRMAAAAIEIGGWALGPGGPAVVEVVHEGEVLGRGIRQERSDLEGAFPEIEGAAAAGFVVDLDGSRLPARAELLVQARVGDEVVPLARLRLRRYWRGALADGIPVVSCLVLCERDDEARLARSLASLAGQRHPFTEVLILRDPSLTPTELRGEGIRRSAGEVLLILNAGTTLSPDALTLGLEMLARAPEAGALLDGDESEISAALYRRSAFEEDGFDPLFAPGALVAGGG